MPILQEQYRQVMKTLIAAVLGATLTGAMQEAEAAVAASASAEAKPKKEREAEQVLMTDGRTVEFVGKRKMLKETIIEGSRVSIRLDFRNGETRLWAIPDVLLLKAA